MTTTEPRRAHSIAEFNETAGRFFVPAEIGASIASWRPRPTDVVISPFGKCGTTWLQQIFHTLRTRGDMDFDDISRVVPWIEMAVACGLDIEHVGRVINVHLPKEMENYLHRVGRTARAGKEGLVINLVTPRDAPLMAEIDDGGTAPTPVRYRRQRT